MVEKTIRVKLFRFDPSEDQEAYYQDFEVPYEHGMSAMDALDYIYQNLDRTIAYYDHAGCTLGICAKCTGRVNGKPGLFCQIAVEEDITLEPVSKTRVLKDLVVRKGE